MDKHSKGPWTYDQDGFVSDANDRAVAQTWSKDETNFNNRENNGPLLAAAPDLLDACHSLLRECRLLRSQLKENGFWTSVDEQFHIETTSKVQRRLDQIALEQTNEAKRIEEQRRQDREKFGVEID